MQNKQKQTRKEKKKTALILFFKTQSPLPRRHAANDEARAGNKYASKSLGDFLCIHSLTSTRQVFRERETKRRRSLREGPLVSRGGAPSHPSNDGLIIHGDEHRTNRSARGGAGAGGSHYSDGCHQMSCVGLRRRADHSTSGRRST